MSLLVRSGVPKWALGETAPRLIPPSKNALKLFLLVASKLTFPGLDVAAKSVLWRKIWPKIEKNKNMKGIFCYNIPVFSRKYQNLGFNKKNTTFGV